MQEFKENYLNQNERMNPQLENMLKSNLSDLAKNPAFPKTDANGNPINFLELIAYKRFLEVIEKVKRYTNLPNVTGGGLGQLNSFLMQGVQFIQQVEAPHKLQLENLAVDLVVNEMEIPDGVFQFQCKLVPVGSINQDGFQKEVEEPKAEEVNQAFENESQELEIPADELFEDEKYKRRFINMLIQGSSKKGHYMFELVRRKINEYNPNLAETYGKVMSINDLIYWLLDDNTIKQMASNPSVMGGKEEIEESEDGSIIKTEAICFPISLHEIIKGVMEVFGTQGLPDDPQQAQLVINAVDSLSNETMDLRLGAVVWEKFVNAYPNMIFEEGNRYLQHYLFSRFCALPTDEFFRVSRLIMSDDPKGAKYLTKMVDEIQNDLQREDYEKNIDDINLDDLLGYAMGGRTGKWKQSKTMIFPTKEEAEKRLAFLENYDSLRNIKMKKLENGYIIFFEHLVIDDDYGKDTTQYRISKLKLNQNRGFEGYNLPDDFKKGGGVEKGYNVFNYTDNVYATDEVFKTKKLANEFIKEFRNRFSRQGYYRDNQMNKIAIEDIDLLAIPTDFSPFRKFNGGGGVDDLKNSLKNDFSFTNLFLPNERPFFLKGDTKVIQNKRMIVITDGKREIIFSSTKPYSKFKKLGNASSSTKELFNKKYSNGGGGVGTKFYVMDAKDGKILSKGFDTEEEAKVEKFKIFEKTNNFFLTQKEMTNDSGGTFVDLFEDYKNIPSNVKSILDEYELEESDYDTLNDLQNELADVGYTFDFGLDYQPYGLRPIGVKITELQGYEDFDDSDKFEGGGEAEFDVYNWDDKMALINLGQIYEYAIELDEIINEDTQLEEWVKMKLTRIEQNIADVKHSLAGWEKYSSGGEIAKKQLLHIAKYSKDLIKMISNGSKLMSWQEGKLSVSAQSIDDIYHHLDYKMGNRAVDLENESEDEYGRDRQVIKKTPNKTKQVNKFVDGGEVEDWMKIALYQLQAQEDNDNLQISYVNDDEFTCQDDDSNEYRVFKNEGIAEEVAVEEVESDISYQPENFNRDFLMDYIEVGDFFVDDFENSNYDYVKEIENESDENYPNRLIAELVENGLITEKEGLTIDPTELSDEYSQDYIDLLNADQIGNDNGVQYFIDNFGEDEFFKIVIDNDLIDFDEASQNAVNMDGIAHFLATYDGETIYLDNNVVAYRTN